MCFCGVGRPLFSVLQIECPHSLRMSRMGGGSVSADVTMLADLGALAI